MTRVVKHIHFVLIIVGVIATQESYAQVADTNRHETAAHERMVEMLEQVRKRGSIENIYTGQNLYATERRQVNTFPDRTAGHKKAALHLLVGKDDLRLGVNQKAIQHLTTAYNLSGKNSTEIAFQLAVAYLRLGETENCLEHNNRDSCIFPLDRDGIHRELAGARNAIRYLTAILRKKPEHLTARWLLNLAHMTLGDDPNKIPEHLAIPLDTFNSVGHFPRFKNIASDLGLNTVSLSGGVVTEDFDGDNFLDIVVSDWSPDGQLRYFRNLGDGSFVERTNEAGFVGLYGGLNLVQADYDNDNDIDIYVLRGAWLEEVGLGYPNSLLQNDGKGNFRDVTFTAGLAKKHFPSQTAAWADYDNDSDLDLYVGNENFPSQLFRNNGDGTFTDVAQQAGVRNNDFAKAVIWGDYNNDHFPDLYVSNFGGANRLYRNRRDGTFSDVAFEVEVNLPYRSFPAWFWDYNNDGNLDLFVSGYEWNVRDVAADYLRLPSMETEFDHLYEGDGKGGFQEVGSDLGLTRITQPMGSNFGDLDNDGFPDFYLGTGYPAYEGLMPNLLFHNDRGRKFTDVTTAAGVGHLQKGHGVAFADFDHDGDLDIFAELGGAFAGDVFGNALFENPGFNNHWIAVKAIGVESNRSAIGVRIRAEIIEQGITRSVYQWINSGGSFGANSLRCHIGLGSAQEVIALDVHWPTTGRTQKFRNLAVNQMIIVTEGLDEYKSIPYSR